MRVKAPPAAPARSPCFFCRVGALSLPQSLPLDKGDCTLPLPAAEKGAAAETQALLYLPPAAESLCFT